ncbi:GspH/FimT family pseudopilin [Deinococcus aerophilus]|uniref:Prepilin-type N-terminal cleavage/methylation domain-containing protein n=1 Tax=Deinococcus aerophilus TaxID=522488 RepID=A0ABQ2GYA3_9DEIO|nr:GspH/FimT family pseudopilin [Deinococcus aerophilus]GGM16954.1 hypothetical protein GCM10010841_26550 [Deinococcus aerophilus]
MSSSRAQGGFTLIELLVVLAIVGVLFALGTYSYLSTRNPPRDAARTVHAALITLRSQAMSNTQARRLILVNDKELILQSSVRCSESDQSKWTPIGTVGLDAGNRPLVLTASKPSPANPTVQSNALLVVCFTSRGMAEPQGAMTAARFLNLTDGRRTYVVEAALNGAVRTGAK